MNSLDNERGKHSVFRRVTKYDSKRWGKGGGGRAIKAKGKETERETCTLIERLRKETERE